MGLWLYLSCGLLLFSGLILGALLVPWKDAGISSVYIVFLGVGLFVGGFIIQRQREKIIERETNEKLSKLETRIENLEKSTDE